MPGSRSAEHTLQCAARMVKLLIQSDLIESRAPFQSVCEYQLAPGGRIGSRTRSAVLLADEQLAGKANE